jgi:hypothetical protein
MGKMGGQPFERVVAVELSATAQREGIRSLWARTKVGELSLDDTGKHKDEITELGLRYSILTPFTSFIAVEEKTISEAGKLRTVEVPVEVPEGVDGHMAGAEMRKMAMQPAMMLAPHGVGGAYRTRENSQVAMAPPPVRSERRDQVAGSRQPGKLAPELESKTASAEKTGVRVYLRAISAGTLDKLKAAGLRILAQPGGANLIIGEIEGTKLMALAAIGEVQMIAPR